MKETARIWRHQQYFQRALAQYVQRVFARLGATPRVNALLLGVRWPKEDTSSCVCLEPERGPLRTASFADLAPQLRSIVESHPELLSNDETADQERASRLRDEAIRQVLSARLRELDGEETRSFIGAAHTIGDYEVFVVLSFERPSPLAVPRLMKTQAQEHFRLPQSLAAAVAEELLRDASTELSRQNVSRLFIDGFERRDADDVLRAAGRAFMYIPALAGHNIDGLRGLFDRCNVVSSLRYEGHEGIGEMIVARHDHPNVDEVLRLREPVILQDATWSRKVLQLASARLSLLSDGALIYGLGRLSPSYDPKQEDAFVIRFIGSYRWELRHGQTILMRVLHGVPTLPKPALAQEAFRRNAVRVLQINDEDADALWSVIALALEQRHGTLVVITPAAAEEANRLNNQATPVEPLRLSEDATRNVTAIDGALLLDPQGLCHAIGVILDGKASPNGTPSRGARYNSTIRYVESSEAPVLAVVVSEDGSVDMFPTLMPQLSRHELRRVLEEGSRGAARHDGEALEDAIRWLDQHRFYLREPECQTATMLLEAYQDLPRAWDELVLRCAQFIPNPEMDDTYFI